MRLDTVLVAIAMLGGFVVSSGLRGTTFGAFVDVAVDVAVDDAVSAVIDASGAVGATTGPSGAGKAVLVAAAIERACAVFD